MNKKSESNRPDPKRVAVKDPGIIREFASFLRYNKKWWIAPILIVTVLMMAMVFLSASPAAPFIYALF
ncbi:DUF5989 family protein [Rubripirellula reticaptiva]|uniref:Uncharacterized protein n=1 Tax=Rubripirellula reticaptiva TaxID=2528013 RepID=A0A5C6EED0_9BACT|nr:DUF5989 family protein [Rubripirellula reticaptiva]TWU48103.1 hypothetical protein Poly59_49480 [Rubripirellula reticaptiva]